MRARIILEFPFDPEGYREVFAKDGEEGEEGDFISYALDRLRDDLDEGAIDLADILDQDGVDIISVEEAPN
jgi:hypothetical protein